MEEKIFEKIKKQELESSKHYFKVLGIKEGEHFTSTIPTKNIDFEILLKKMKLLKKDSYNLDTINDFHDYLFKLGIEIGINSGKQLFIDATQNEEVDFEKIKDVDAEKLVAHNIIPTFISDLQEDILNGKQTFNLKL